MNEFEVLGETFQAAAGSIMQRIHDNIKTMDFHEIQELTNKAQDLLMKSRSMFAAAVIKIGKDTEPSVQKLFEAKQQIAHAIKTIKNVQKVIDVSAKLVALGGKALSGDAAGVISGVNEVLESVSGEE